MSNLNECKERFKSLDPYAWTLQLLNRIEKLEKKVKNVLPEKYVYKGKKELK